MWDLCQRVTSSRNIALFLIIKKTGLLVNPFVVNPSYRPFAPRSLSPRKSSAMSDGKGA